MLYPLSYGGGAVTRRWACRRPLQSVMVVPLATA